MGQPLRTARLRQYIDLAERRLQLLELRYQLRPRPPERQPDGGAVLVLVPVHHQSQSLDLSLGYESNLGGETGFTYRTVNFGGVGVEGEMGGARNRLQDEVCVAIRGPVAQDFPGPAWQLPGLFRAPAPGRAPGLRQPHHPAPGSTSGRIDRRDLGLGWFVRFGNLGQGKTGLDAGWREAAASGTASGKSEPRAHRGTVHRVGQLRPSHLPPGRPAAARPLRRRRDAGDQPGTARNLGTDVPLRLRAGPGAHHASARTATLQPGPGPGRGVGLRPPAAPGPLVDPGRARPSSWAPRPWAT